MMRLLSIIHAVIFSAVLTAPLIHSLKIASALGVLEWTPELIAKEDYFKGDVDIVNGGIASLYSDPTVDLGSNSETQLLLQFGSHKNLRTIGTVAEVYYRIVANRKSEISSLMDLRGKRIGAVRSTSSEYFIQVYLATVGLKPADYTIVNGLGCLQEPCGAGTFPTMLRDGKIDAIGMWEPSVQLGADALGSDAVVFGGNQTTYREIYNLATTAEKLNDAKTRDEIVQFLRALKQAENIFRSDPQKVIDRAAEAVKTNGTLLEAVWPVHRWDVHIPSDMLDVLVDEDKFVAPNSGRQALPRESIATLIDSSVLDEALQI
ncbi:periplasmic binding protein-like II [Annulohypoxylon maeteangense]|uniref:periplasmic binding protein-like II n=1 Tax=Annulohypoxylon maeteangense TaxID=1927788 RepID=UPI0020075EEF|nr:periplasmic binding protein-like II [Annulohypoxylon maeteangense]KAI0879845.1 periplasmic binding protein-like II [Annulohypoxylon maeteangense]